MIKKHMSANYLDIRFHLNFKIKIKRTHLRNKMIQILITYFRMEKAKHQETRMMKILSMKMMIMNLPVKDRVIM